MSRQVTGHAERAACTPACGPSADSTACRDCRSVSKYLIIQPNSPAFSLPALAAQPAALPRPGLQGCPGRRSRRATGAHMIALPRLGPLAGAYGPDLQALDYVGGQPQPAR